jgi:hypothetical protein
MAYSADGLNLVSGSKAGNAPQVWAYQTADTAATVDTTGYFNTAASLLKVGDMMYVYSGVGGTPAYGIMIVLSNTGTVVDMSDATTLGGTDTD